MRPTDKQILTAAKNIVAGEERYCCEALARILNCYHFQVIEFDDFMKCHTKPLIHQISIGWFGDISEPESQLARSLALLLYKEARKDVL